MKRIIISVLLAGFAGSGAYAADFGSLNATAAQLKAAAAENTAVAVPNVPKPPAKGTTPATDVTGDISELVHGVALHEPTLRDLHFLALTGDEILEFRNNSTQRALLENMRATALCNFLGYGKALLTTVGSESIDRITMLNIEPSGALTQNNYEYSLRYDVTHYIKYYPAYLAEVVCAPKGQ